ncbi:MAG: phage portal protein [Phycisphaerales bacterium]|jgi:hypothetical protein|nr:phage portal protein [Phycisphaerales bacterium]MBT7171259.1 phage portal protein [Phycisphaerales bacterium]
MTFELAPFQDSTLHDEHVRWLIDQLSPAQEPLYRRLWNYYRNPMTPAPSGEQGRAYRLAQEEGLPPRITGEPGAGPNAGRKEVVIENDIAWRVNTMVDYLFGRGVTLRSRATDPARAEAIEAILGALLAANGSELLLEEMALFASVYGFVDVALRVPANFAESIPPSDDPLETAIAAAGNLRLEPIEAPRVIPILESDNYRQTRYWVQRYFRSSTEPTKSGAIRRLLNRTPSSPKPTEIVEILSPSWWQRYENRRLVAQGPNALGRLPIVHIQNIAAPGSYAGFSDVEPMIPLQDELNTRLCDRAHRVTYQSFKMYLGKGIDDFLERPVGPGQMWATGNLNASIEEFGADDGSPSEDLHIDQIRQGLDKLSGVTPLAAGILRGQIGNLSSATALRVMLSGLLSRTARKRLTFATGLGALMELALDFLDRSNLFATTPAERKIDVLFPDPLPNDETHQLENARLKQQLGISQDRILAELGYDRASVEDSAE